MLVMEHIGTNKVKFNL